MTNNYLVINIGVNKIKRDNEKKICFSEIFFQIKIPVKPQTKSITFLRQDIHEIVLVINTCFIRNLCYSYQIRGYQQWLITWLSISSCDYFKSPLC